MIFIGIDPGLFGAIAAIDGNGNIVLLEDTPIIAVKNGKSCRNTYLEPAMASILENAKSLKIQLVFLENVHSMPQQGVSSTFKLGQGFGTWLGILAALRIPYERVEPAKWKREMGIASGSDKGASIIRASQLFPAASLSRKKDDGRADALLLAEWGRRKLLGKA